MIGPRFIIGITIFIAIFVLLYFDETFMTFGNFADDDWVQYTEEASEVIEYDDQKNTPTLLFDRCDLPELDPWDPFIAKHFKPFQEPLNLCRPNAKQISKLINGQLFLYLPKSGNFSCHRRCLLPKSDHDLVFAEWIKVENGTRPKCDIFEVKCGEAHNNETYFTFYKFLHSQIHRIEPSESIQVDDDLQKPDVHIIVLDSVSESQFIRSMSKTRHILREHYEAITFRHLNKVGLNSRPNGFAFLLGKSIYPIAKSPVSKGHKSDYQSDAFCNKNLDHDQFIGFRFQDDGYKTMMSEDWAAGVFNWPNCKGYKTKPTDHYMRPFQIRLEGNKKFKDFDMKNILYQGSCKEPHHYNMKYLQDFIDAYPDKPKFSITWMSYLAHSNINALYHTDEFFYRFFSDNMKKLNNSFVFIMGDHGNRYGPFRNTFNGEAEDNNPFLFLSVPAKIRRNTALMETVKQNAKQLITHYDIYATLNKITDPSNPRIAKPLIKGNSLFHPLPQPRTCDKLRIPFEYCVCNAKNKQKLPKDNKIAIPGAQLMIAQMNSDLQNSPETNKCSNLTLNPDKGITVYQLNSTSNVKIYHVTYSTLPGNGQFWGFITETDGKMTILSDKFPRLNSYAGQTNCALNAKFISYCFCKNLVKQKTRVSSIQRKHVISNFINQKSK